MIHICSQQNRLCLAEEDVMRIRRKLSDITKHIICARKIVLFSPQVLHLLITLN